MEKKQDWISRHPVLTTVIVIFIIAVVWSYIKPSCQDSTLSINRNYANDNVGTQQKQKIALNFSGSSDTVTDPFYAEGLIFFKAKYTGNSNFILYLVDESGEKTYLFNEIGKYTGTKSATLTPGNYRLEVEVGTSYTGSGFTSNGNWNIEISN